jgi:hypothetical protein
MNEYRKEKRKKGRRKESVRKGRELKKGRPKE